MLPSAKAAACLVMLALAMAAPLEAMAQPFERPPTFAIEQVPGFFPSGDNYTIKNPVRSDGLLRLFTVTTPYGEYTVHGDQMLRMRLNELAALHELEKIAGSESYGKALLDAGLSPFRYTGRLITDPGKTVGDTFSGIGTMFGRISSDIANAGKTPGDPISGLLGVTDQKRKLATKVRVDPYTDFPPLDAKLSRLSEAAAAGGLTVSAAMMAVPTSAVAIIYSNLGTASTIEGVRIDELARDQTAAQIFDINRERLRAMGVANELIEALIVNTKLHPDRHGRAGGGPGQHEGRRGARGVPRTRLEDRLPLARLFHAASRGNGEKSPEPGRGFRALRVARRLSVQRHS